MEGYRNTVIIDLEAYDEMVSYTESLRKELDRKCETIAKMYALVKREFRHESEILKHIPTYVTFDAVEIADIIGYFPEDDQTIIESIAEPVEELTEVVDDGYQE